MGCNWPIGKPAVPFELVIEDTGIDYGNLPIATDHSGVISESPASGLLRVAYGAQRLLDRGSHGYCRSAL